jgi:hypothetical protein
VLETWRPKGDEPSSGIHSQEHVDREQVRKFWMKETSFSANNFADVLRRQLTTEADFTYSISGNVISIVDLNLGNRSVTNDIENVLCKMEYYTITRDRSRVLRSCTAIRSRCGMECIGTGIAPGFSRCARLTRDKRGLNCWIAMLERVKANGQGS